jgi:chromosome partitioning protein
MARAARERPGTVIAVFNPAGGVGKTTTAVNVAAVLASRDRRVLVVDLEPYAAASISFGVRISNLRPSVADVLLGNVRASDAVRSVPGLSNLHLMTASPALTDMDKALRHARQPDHRLADAIRPLSAGFDYVVLDSPVGYSLLAVSVPFAAQHIIVPVPAEYLALEALAHFLRWYRDFRAGRKGLATLLGIVMTMVDYRVQATREIVEIIRVHNRQGVFHTEIPRDPRVTEAPSHGVPAVIYAPSSRASEAYHGLTDEIVHRLSRARR